MAEARKLEQGRERGAAIKALLAVRNPWGALLVLLAALAAGTFVLWRHERSRLTIQSDYLARLDDVIVTPAPPWIRADVKQEALRNASLDAPLPIMEADLTEQVAKAFSVHPWVAKVERVT